MNKMHDITDLENTATRIRIDIINSICAAGSGHTGGSLGLADIFTALYFSVLMHDPLNPGWQERDRLILSIGHVAPVLYTTLAHAGYFGREELKTLRKLGSRLQGHPGKEHGLPGLEISSGSLGQGLSVAAGLALSARINNKSWKVYSVHGDGELQEGSIWEAAMSASHHKLNNMVAIIDRNRVQIDGKTSDVMELEPLTSKWRAFGWNVFECNGNNMKEVMDTFGSIRVKQDKPVVVIAHTIMGKGVAEIEGDYRWHGRAPTKEEAVRFIRQINNHQG